LDRLIVALASAGYAGFSPRAPGTVGTAVGTLVYLLFSPFPPLVYLLSTGAFLALSCWVSERAEVLLGQKDSPRIVIDEAAGYLITMALLPCTYTTIAGGFLFFRIFDIMKPPPAGWINRQMKGGLGVVLDDAVAGGYANALLWLLSVLYPDFFFLLGR
jgi:phosphatidylglycerophosphatase A